MVELVEVAEGVLGPSDPDRFLLKIVYETCCKCSFLIILVLHLEVVEALVVEIMPFFAVRFCIWLVACKVSLTKLKVKDKTHPPPLQNY